MSGQQNTHCNEESATIPPPPDLAGYQQVMEGRVEQGDMLVFHGQSGPAEHSIGCQIHNGELMENLRVYRKIDCPKPLYHPVSDEDRIGDKPFREPQPATGQGNVRTFASGATRDTDEGKLCYKGFLSPAVLRRFSEYMHKHRHQSDGTLRAADNWKKGIPIDAYTDSLIRHVVEFWAAIERGDDDSAEETACAIMFNTQGYLHETLKKKCPPTHS